jgi:uncharacterized protein YjbI with pentapeptide repeats
MQYFDVLSIAGRVFDCSKVLDLRGVSIGGRYLINHEGRDFTGALLYQSFPSGFKGAVEISPSATDRVSLQGITLDSVSIACADLMSVNLRDARFRDVDFTEANLQDADLRGAHFFQAYFWGTNLRGADLRNTTLINAKFQGADLQRANLEGAHLSNSDLSRADLSFANLRGAHLGAATMFTSLEGAVYDQYTQFQHSGILKRDMDAMVFIESPERRA